MKIQATVTNDRGLFLVSTFTRFADVRRWVASCEKQFGNVEYSMRRL